jgi:thioredoxin reductase (NADPH)
VLVLSNRPQESPLAKATRIDNYPGMPNIKGADLLDRMLEQAQDLGVEFIFERVISILPMGEYFSLTAGKDLVEARSVILAIGIQ